MEDAARQSPRSAREQPLASPARTGAVSSGKMITPRTSLPQDRSAEDPEYIIEPIVLSDEDAAEDDLNLAELEEELRAALAAEKPELQTPGAPDTEGLATQAAKPNELDDFDQLMKDTKKLKREQCAQRTPEVVKPVNYKP